MMIICFIHEEIQFIKDWMLFSLTNENFTKRN